MSQGAHRFSSDDTDPELDAVEQICHGFLQSLERGTPKPIERLLSKVAAADQPRLLRGLLIIDLRSRRSSGADPQPAEYEERFPGESALIRQVFELVPPAKRKPEKRPVPAPLAAAPPARSRNAAEKSAAQGDAATAAKAVSRAPAVKSPAVPAENSPPKKVRPKGVKEAAGRAPSSAKPPESQDEFAALVASDAAKARIPPPVVHKKKKKEKPDRGTVKRRRPSESLPATEFLIPLGIAMAGFVIEIVMAFATAQAGLPAGWYVAYKLGFIVVSTVVTTLALFVAAALLDTTYGYFHTALVKIVAIVLTQAWLGDVLGLIPVPFVGALIAWLATFYMFVAFFDLDHLEAIRSMVIVRGAHTVAFVLLFAGFLSWVASGGHGGDAAFDGGNVEMDIDDDGVLRPVPAGNANDAPPRKLTGQFGDALVAEDYPRAYQLMSPGYQAVTTLEEFAALHRQAVAQFGKPLRCEPEVETLDPAELKGPGFARFASVPPEIRRAWTNAELAIELDEGEMVRCCNCRLLLVESGDGLRVGALEYGSCD